MSSDELEHRVGADVLDDERVEPRRRGQDVPEEERIHSEQWAPGQLQILQCAPVSIHNIGKKDSILKSHSEVNIMKYVMT